MPRRSRKRRWQSRASRSTFESDRATAVAKLRPSTRRSDRPAALQRRPTTGASPLSGQARSSYVSEGRRWKPHRRPLHVRRTRAKHTRSQAQTPRATCTPIRHPGESRHPRSRRTRRYRAVITRPATMRPGVRRDDGGWGRGACDKIPPAIPGAAAFAPRQPAPAPAPAPAAPNPHPQPPDPSDPLRSSPPPQPPGAATTFNPIRHPGERRDPEPQAHPPAAPGPGSSPG